ncbi:hypothetical protein DFR50_1464 [Roseiarcus fermentans]|uniref:Glycosyltransferase RgtA/B/C/D-like domain-containing protein n=1 Tax=Roseiarcus fermentans TaxID=1473586 RepID=A0A366EMZ8_9HYPH|nr:hypothetical protein [Roseiarcus fermentans]RBP03080.1 hypothetical protein DFR50_1464 [Roseiarcus fermentans]
MLRTFSPDSAAFRLALAASLFLILVGTRAALIGFAGGATPYMDEWDGDWGGLIKPWLDGRLTVDALVAPFNEHRILFTRLLVLALFNLSGAWDVVLQMIVNAIVGSAVVVVVALALARVLDGAWAASAIVAIALVNVVPMAFDNILLGFNSHFYLLPLLSLFGLRLAVSAPAWSGRWAAGALIGAASYFCMASGALTLAALAATHAIQMACGRRRGAAEALGIVALGGATLVMIAFVPHVPESDAFRARSPGEFLSAALALVEWPGGWVFGLLLPLPSLLFCLRVSADRPDRRDPRWFNVAALAWVAGQITAIAVGRAQGVLMSRYFDTLALGLAIHFVSALWLLQTQADGQRRRKAARLAFAAWVAVFGVGLIHAERHLPRKIEAWREDVETGGENIRFYLATGDASFISGRPGSSIPFPSPDRLRAYLDAPEARVGLPPELLSRQPHPTRVGAIKRDFVRFAPASVGLGAVALVALLWRWSSGSRARAGANGAIDRAFREASA